MALADRTSNLITKFIIFKRHNCKIDYYLNVVLIGAFSSLSVFPDNSEIQLKQIWKFVEFCKCKYMFLYIIRKRVLTLYSYDILNYRRLFMTSHCCQMSVYDLTLLPKECLRP